jgi:membrane associated rhomboid family serine protease
MAIYRITGKKRLVSINTKLIFLNVICFILFSLLIYFKVLSIDSVAIKPSNVMEMKYLWTFLTSMFMHAGFFHLLVNMHSLFFVGSITEKILGGKRYLGFYLIAGLFAGLFFVLTTLIPYSFFSNDFNTYAVGASGALFALVGLLMLITPNLRVFVMFIPIPIKLKYAGPGMLVVLWLISIAGDVPIGNMAHLGGLLVGLIYGVYLRKKYPNKIKNLNNIFA